RGDRNDLGGARFAGNRVEPGRDRRGAGVGQVEEGDQAAPLPWNLPSKAEIREAPTDRQTSHEAVDRQVRGGDGEAEGNEGDGGDRHGPLAPAAGPAPQAPEGQPARGEEGGIDRDAPAGARLEVGSETAAGIGVP